MYHNIHYLFNILFLYFDRKQRETFFVKILYSLPEYRSNKKGKLFFSKSFTVFLGKYSRTDFFGNWINVFILKIDLCTIIYIIYSTFYANIPIKTSPKLFLSKSFTAFLGKYSKTDFFGDWINVFILKIDLWTII